MEEFLFNERIGKITIIENITDKTAGLIKDESLKKHFIHASKKVKETLTFDLVVDNECLAGISLDIAKESDKSFKMESKKL